MKKMSRGVASIAIFCLFTANFITAAEKIDINTAPLTDLVKIIHIGEARAQELISLRPFTSIDDLIKIKGIGEARIKDIKQQGLAWVSGKLEAKPPTSELQQSPEIFGAAASAPAQKSPFFLLIAGALAAFSGIIILVLKRKLK